MGIDNDIVQEPAGGGTVTPVITGGTDDYQPSVSPDGQQLCFIRGAFGTNDAEVHTANVNGTGVALFSYDDNVASYNCTWSPDGTTIAYADGTFSNGDLIIQTGASGAGGLPIPIETTASRFDGNPDWALDGRPGCEDGTATTTVGTPVTITVSCPDTGPDYERSNVTGFIDTEAQSGTTSPSQDDPAFPVPRNVTYTPNPGFLGTDTFRVRSFDEFGFGNRTGTITITVQLFGRTLTLDANKSKVKKGKKVTLSGDVSAAGNVAGCEANQPVEIQRKKPSQSDFTAFQQLQTDGQGGFSLTTKVKKTFQYRAVLGETQTCEDATTDPKKVKAKKKKKK